MFKEHECNYTSNGIHIGLWFHPPHYPTSTVITMVALKYDAQYYTYTFHQPDPSGYVIPLLTFCIYTGGV